MSRSSHIQASSYDPGKRTLTVHFPGGVIYHYFDVTADTAEAFRQAESQGRYIHQFLGPNHTYRRVDKH